MTTSKKLWALLTVGHRRTVIVLLGLMLIGMVMETMGIGLVIPALTLMTQNDLAARYPVLVPWLDRLGNPSHEQLVIIGMLTLVGVYAIKALFLGFLIWRQMHFIFWVQADLSQRFFIGYMSQPYAFHLQRNSAQLIRNVVTETHLFTHSALISVVALLTELLVLIGILVLLFVVEPYGTVLVVGPLGLVCWGILRLTRRHTLRWGEARQVHEGFRIQHLQQGLGGVKDVKLLGREDDFLSQYQLHNEGSARAGRLQSTILQMPRLLLEFIAVVGLAALVLVLIGQGKSPGSLLPTMGLFAVASFRLMPSANRILSAIQSLRYALPVISILHSELQQMEATQVPQRGRLLPFNNKLTLGHVTFQYPSTDTPVLHDISISIPRGTSAGFIGGSGAGKSTLVDIILGLLTPDQGFVKIDGIDIQSNLRGWQDQIGYVPQIIFLTDDNLRRNVAFGLANEQIDEAAVWRAIRAAQLEEFVHTLPDGLDTLVGERGIRLSGGQRQRIGIARALYHDPSVLVLDEATSSLDTATERGVMDAVRALKGDKTLLIVAHRLSTVEHCDRLFRIEQGEVVEEGEAVSILEKAVSPTFDPRIKS